MGVNATTWNFTGAVYSPVHNRIYLTANISQQSSSRWYFVDCNDGSVGYYVLDFVTDTDNINCSQDFIGGSYSPTENKIYLINSLDSSNITDSKRWVVIEEGGNHPVDKWLMGHSMFN